MNNNRRIEITFLGDLMCQMQQIWAVKKAACGYDVVFEQVKDLWRNSDYVVANLETPVTGKGFRLAFEEMRFNAPIEFLAAIRHSGIDFVSTANNHILDRGRGGLDATLANIDRVGLDTTGTYREKEQSQQIFIKEISGVRFAFVACTYDTNSGRKSDMLERADLWKIDYLHAPSPFIGTLSFAIKRTLKGLIPYCIKAWLLKGRGERRWSAPQADSFAENDFYHPEHAYFLHNICAKIKRARTLADVVIVLPHIGGQYNANPGPWQLKITDALIDAGADLVVVNHAHTPLKIEERNSRLIVHALGNFCFTPRVGFYNDKCQADYSLVLQCGFDTETKKLHNWRYFIVKTQTRQDGVSVVGPIGSEDDHNSRIIIERVGTLPNVINKVRKNETY